ncbi:unnamed protein product [Haemonchus placei]|uniref:IMS_C domain-containing protein n=1 Tax=Haemonchus placei TaxID=6290 RepID=A0A0N4W1K8_HAEPC|nr:unnamed protein product [Haemonchus placei]
MDALYEKLDSREGEKFVFRLAKASHRATQDIGVVKSVRNSEGAILKKPSEVQRRCVEEEHYRSNLKQKGDGVFQPPGYQVECSYNEAVRAAGRLMFERIGPNLTGAVRLHA